MWIHARFQRTSNLLVILDSMEIVHVHEILQPVQITGSTLNPGRQYRISKNAPYVNASQRWWIELLFNSDVDVAVFEKALMGCDVRFIEFNGRFFIEDHRMPDVGDQIENGFDPISKYAVEELPRLNTALKIICPEFIPAKLRCIIYISNKGQGHPISIAQGVTHGVQSLRAMVAFLDNPSPRLAAVLRLYAANADVREALLYFGLEGNPWPSLYKVREIIADSLGGDTNIFDRQWCSRNELARFDRTANHQGVIGQFSRHARTKVAPPPSPMTESEARTFLLNLITLWTGDLLQSEH